MVWLRCRPQSLRAARHGTYRAVCLRQAVGCLCARSLLQGVSLPSYTDMQPSDGGFAERGCFINKERVLVAKSIKPRPVPRATSPPRSAMFRYDYPLPGIVRKH